MDTMIIFCAKYVYLLVVLGILLALIRVQPSRRWHFILVVLVGGLLAFALSRLAGQLFYDPRPFVRDHVTPLIPHAANNGFPSDHALLTMTLTAVAFFFHKRIAGGMLLLTVIVSIARVLAKIHSPIDIMGGWLIGITGAVLGYVLIHYVGDILNRTKS
ncbi:MAG: phosphatase PAP2 family protein [Candidatus Saccharimonadales bacterium]